MYKHYIKRLLDIILATICFIIIMPVFFLIALYLTFINLGTPFFVQSRPGKNSKIFKAIKFKTMNDHKDAIGDLLSDSERLTAIGRFVRKTSLDEIPQLLNVIKGDMSLVGPRPLLVEYLTLFSKEQCRRHEVRPGMTGWAQVNGRNAISWQEKLKLDVWYIDNLSFKLDIKILFMTGCNVLKGKGISKQGHATTEKFNGQN